MSSLSSLARALEVHVQWRSLQPGESLAMVMGRDGFSRSRLGGGFSCLFLPPSFPEPPLRIHSLSPRAPKACQSTTGGGWLFVGVELPAPDWSDFFETLEHVLASEYGV